MGTRVWYCDENIRQYVGDGDSDGVDGKVCGCMWLVGVDCIDIQRE